MIQINYYLFNFAYILNMDNPFDAVMGWKAKAALIAVSFTSIFVCSWVGYAE